jgi:hypothetical protein
MTSQRRTLLAAALYVAAMILVSDFRPLWLDEILQLLDTRGTTPTELIVRLRSDAGAAPLGYLTQQSSLYISKYSVRRARLPSAVFSGGALLVTIFLAAELGLATAWTGWIFAALPLTVRYATESRVYSEALFFSVLATFLYVRLANKPGWKLAGAYFLVLVSAAYTQPYAASVGLAHVLWSLICRERKAAWFGGSAFAATVLAFLPWYFRTGAHAAAAIGHRNPHFSVSLKTPLMLFRELAGGGYWASGLSLVLCALALVSGNVTKPTSVLIRLLITVPLVSGIAADALFDYFLAARQFIWTLPAIVILAAATARRRPYEVALLAILSAICVGQTIRFLAAPGEDWQAASDAIEARTKQGACLLVTPGELYSTFEFFHPNLSHLPCDQSRLILALTPYSTPDQRSEALDKVRSMHYSRESEMLVGGTTIVAFVAQNFNNVRLLADRNLACETARSDQVRIVVSPNSRSEPKKLKGDNL